MVGVVIVGRVKIFVLMLDFVIRVMVLKMEFVVVEWFILVFINCMFRLGFFLVGLGL